MKGYWVEDEDGLKYSILLEKPSTTGSVRFTVKKEGLDVIQAYAPIYRLPSLEFVTIRVPRLRTDMESLILKLRGSELGRLINVTNFLEAGIEHQGCTGIEFPEEGKPHLLFDHP